MNQLLLHLEESQIEKPPELEALEKSTDIQRGKPFYFPLQMY